jgi:hypothetical protein
MPRTVNNAYAAMPDFFKDLIITYSPLGIPYIEFAKHILKRLLRVSRRNPSAQTLNKQTA